MNFTELDHCFIVAEIGVNHEGNVDTAAKLLELAAETGVDAVKFQVYSVDQYISRSQPERYERSKRFALTYDEFRQLHNLAKELKVLFFASAMGESDVDFLDEIAPVFKVSSGDLTYHPLLAHMAAKGKPIILSTGGATVPEIDAAVEVIRVHGPQRPLDEWLMLNQCTACYPAPNEEVNLRAISFLRDRYGLKVGYSDHTLGTTACIAAVALGAVAIEKHFTDSRANKTFHDHSLSSEPAEMAQLVQAIREVEAALGSTNKFRTACEETTLPRLRRGLALQRDMQAGEVVTQADLAYVRPQSEYTIGMEDEVVGRTLTHKINAGHHLQADDLAH